LNRWTGRRITGYGLLIISFSFFSSGLSVHPGHRGPLALPAYSSYVLVLRARHTLPIDPHSGAVHVPTPQLPTRLDSLHSARSSWTPRNRVLCHPCAMFVLVHDRRVILIPGSIVPIAREPAHLLTRPHRCLTIGLDRWLTPWQTYFAHRYATLAGSSVIGSQRSQSRSVITA
jgi:hypothetical protein